MRIKHTFLFTLLLGLAWASILFAHETGPDPGVNGIFGPANTCAVAGCHSSFAINNGGTIAISGLPAQWTPGQLYPLMVTLSRTGAAYGFQLSAVFDSSTTQAGTFSNPSPSPPMSVRPPAGGIVYVQHNLRPATVKSFAVNWTAPASGGTVRFNVAGNVANGDSQPTGDFIYTQEIKVAPATAPAADFSISAAPDSSTVSAGNNTAYTVSVAAINGFSGSVGLSVGGLPTGASGSFSPASITAGVGSTLTVTAAGSVAVGTYPLTITGVNGGLNHSALTTLNVTAAGVAARAFTLGNLGGTSFITDGGGGSIDVGYSRIQPDGGNTTPSGVAIFGYRNPSNILVSETGVPASPLMTSGRIYAEVSGPVNTGLAIANPSDLTAHIQFFFTDANGINSAVGTGSIAPNQQTARFLDQLNQNDFTSPQTFSGVGTFSFTSDVPVSVIALRGFTNETRNDFLMTTLPVINTSAAPKIGTQFVPYFANGGGWTTQVVLVNPGDTALTGTVQFFDAGGAPVTLNVNGQTSYSIPARSSRKLVTVGSITASTATGSVRVIPAGGGTAPTALAVFSFKPGSDTLTEAGAPANSATAFRMYVESSGAEGQPGNVQSGIAVSNSTASAANVTFELFNLDGTLAAAQTQALAPAGLYVKFLGQIFPGLTTFKGVLRISTASSSVAVVGLRGRYNERREFLITTTPPTVESDPASAAELLFPQVVNGGGYTTQFILFSGTAGQASSGTLRFVRADGSSFSLQFN